MAPLLSPKKILSLVAIITALLFSFPALTFAVDPNQLTPKLNITLGDGGPSVIFKAVSCSGGECTIGWIGDYVGAIYRYGVAMAAVLAVLMIMIGGVLWLTSAGAPERVNTAKSFITAAVSGLTLALLSFTILYTVNPALVALKPLKIAAVENIKLAQAGDPASDGLVGKIACETSTHTISYSSVGLPPPQIPDVLPPTIDELTGSTPTIEQTSLAPSRIGALALPENCRQYNFDGYGVDPNVLRAIAAAESSCNRLAVNTGGGAYGLMQLTLPTARRLAGRDITGEEIQRNPQLSIELAARYIAQNQSVHQGNVAHILAGYNSGYGTVVGSDGTRPALAPSVDCPNSLAYECCINPGGLEETQGYVIRGMRYYQGAQNGQYQ